MMRLGGRLLRLLRSLQDARRVLRDRQQPQSEICVPDPGDLASADSFISSLRLSNGIFKTTAARRLDELNDFVAPHVPRSGVLTVMDVGASTGVSTLEWSDHLSGHGVAHRMIATDLTPSATLLTVGRRLGLLWQDDGHPLALQIGKRCICSEESHLLPVLWPRLGRVFTLLGKLRRGPVNAPAAAWRIRLRRVELVHRDARARSITFAQDDITQPGRFRHRADVCRVANLLIRVYFSDEQIRSGIRNVTDRVKEGGLLILCRTDGERGAYRNLATLLRKDQDGLRVVSRLNGGVDVEDLLSC